MLTTSVGHVVSTLYLSSPSDSSRDRDAQPHSTWESPVKIPIVQLYCSPVMSESLRWGPGC